MQAVALLAIVLVILVAPVGLAQDYRFSVPENVVNVYIEQDGTVYVVLAKSALSVR